MWGWFGQMMGTDLGESTAEFEQVLAWIWKLFWSAKCVDPMRC